MRLWHKDLISALPQKQLLGQWRECCLIAKNIAEKGKPNHLLVNKIIEYPISHFFWYSNEVACELERRKYFVDFNKFTKWISDPNQVVFHDDLFSGWHNFRYLTQCYYNLSEKYDCNGISLKEWEQIVEKYMNLKFNESRWI